MAALGSQLRQFAELLTDAPSMQVITDVKDRLLSLAEDMEMKRGILLHEVIL